MKLINIEIVESGFGAFAGMINFVVGAFQSTVSFDFFLRVANCRQQFVLTQMLR